MTVTDFSCTIQIHIDLDTPHILNRFYRGPKGDNAPDDEFCYTLLQRVGSFFDEVGIKATFFVITKDLQLSRYGALLKQIQCQGHEIASHSHTHPYFSSDLQDNLIRDEIQTSFEEIRSFFNVSPKGYRSPGFFFKEEMDLIRETSSVKQVFLVRK